MGPVICNYNKRLILLSVIQLSGIYMIFDVFELHDGNSNEAIISECAIIFDRNVKLVEANRILVSNNTERK